MNNILDVSRSKPVKSLQRGGGTVSATHLDGTHMQKNYYFPVGGHPPQTNLLSDRAIFTEAYAIIPKGVMRDIVTSYLPFWTNTRLWVLSRPDRKSVV